MADKIDPRNIIRDLLQSQLIGPKQDVFICEPETELIPEPPLNAYYSGILFPKLSLGTNNQKSDNPDTVDVVVDKALEDTDGDSVIQCDNIDGILDQEDVEAENVFNSEFYPNSMGLSFCIDNHAGGFKCSIEYGSYTDIDPSGQFPLIFSIPYLKGDFETIASMGVENSMAINRISDVVGYDELRKCAYLKRPLRGIRQGKDRTGDYLLVDTIKGRIVKKKNETKDKDEIDRLSKILSLFDKLGPLFMTAWRRSPHKYDINVAIDELHQNVIFKEGINLNDNIILRVNRIKRTIDYSIYRVVLWNHNTVNNDMYITINEEQNRKAIFQCSITVLSDMVMKVPDFQLAKGNSQEDKILDFQYRGTSEYGLAHNCSLMTKHIGTETELRTTFLPNALPPIMVNNNLHPELSEVLNVQSNSVFSKHENVDIISGLWTMCEAYTVWISKQKSTNDEEQKRSTQEQRIVSEGIISHQDNSLMRMKRGVAILAENPIAMECYKLANAAMLVNMTMNRHPIEQDQLLQFYQSTNFSDVNYHLFQLAFLLQNVDSVVNAESKERTDLVDILWFPTGGGKTEAYLLLAAFTLLMRRTVHGQEGMGTAIIMRYTLRLLTAQQFERAVKLVLSLNFICDYYAKELTSSEKFYIGLWIGSKTSPNKLKDGEKSAEEINLKIMNSRNLETAKEENEFPIETCPWCSSQLITENDRGIQSSFYVNHKRLVIRCPNQSCYFHDLLPIDFVDESLYNNPPSILFATVDKFAQLAWVFEASALFGIGLGYLPPELIIQDELHLISGPLGTTTGFFENIVDLLCSKDKLKPKIIASTATIKNSSTQIERLYGKRKAFSFPPPGLDYRDNFFSVISEDKSMREYFGVYPTGKSFVTLQVKMIALILYVRWLLVDDKVTNIDDYWTLVSYHNSLRELGRISNKTRDEIIDAYKHLVNKRFPDKRSRMKINYPSELTSRIDGNRIRKVLSKVAQSCVDINDIDETIKGATDIVFATNMISVGLDIGRLNMILINGQPRSISEYIQVTSRIARNKAGVVVTLFNPLRIRDKSHFESFVHFHNTYYCQIEPISVTPFTISNIDRMLPTSLAVFLRIKKGLVWAKDATDEVKVEFLMFLTSCIEDVRTLSYASCKLDSLWNRMKDRIEIKPDLKIADMLEHSNEANTYEDAHDVWLTMSSMRDVGPSSIVKTIVNINRSAR